MKKIITIFTLIVTSSLFATDGSWIATDLYPTLHDWSETSAWAGGIVADGAGDIAFFTNGIATVGVSGIKAITMSANPTIGNVFFDLDVYDPSALYVLAGGTFLNPDIILLLSTRILSLKVSTLMKEPVEILLTI